MTDPRSSSTLVVLDALDAHDREQARLLTPAEKLEQALEVMRTGIRLKRVALCRQYPEAGAEEIDRRLAEWLADG
jgi:hypothetical protein